MRLDLARQAVGTAVRRELLVESQAQKLRSELENIGRRCAEVWWWRPFNAEKG
jgi:hypothetical protein